MNSRKRRNKHQRGRQRPSRLALAEMRPDTEQRSEFFYKDKDGKPQDKDLHKSILSGIDCDAEARVRSIGKELARKAGLTEAEIKKLYADD